MGNISTLIKYSADPIITKEFSVDMNIINKVNSELNTPTLSKKETEREDYYNSFYSNNYISN